MQAEARVKPRPELDGTAQPREGNKKPSGARIRRYTSLPQGAWSILQREAGNHFNMLKATNTARRHTVGTQIPEKEQLQEGAREGQDRVDNRVNSRLSLPPTLSDTHKNQQSPTSISHMRHAHQQQDPVSPPLHV